MNSELIVSTILEKNGFVNYQFKKYTEYQKVKKKTKHGKRNADRSWCDYRPHGRTTIYFKPSNNPIENIVMAAHEACHVLNYSEHRVSFKKVQFLIGLLNRLLWFYVACFLLLPATTMLGYVSIYVTGILLFIVHTLLALVGTKCVMVHQRDEELTERRALKELKEIIDDRSVLKEIEVHVRRRMKKQIKPIYRAYVFFLLVAPFGFLLGSWVLTEWAKILIDKLF